VIFLSILNILLFTFFFIRFAVQARRTAIETGENADFSVLFVASDLIGGRTGGWFGLSYRKLSVAGTAGVVSTFLHFKRTFYS
jgi:hypothetical protein